MVRNDLRIDPFEAHRHFLSIANPPRPQIPSENFKNRHFPKNQKIRKPDFAKNGKHIYLEKQLSMQQNSSHLQIKGTNKERTKERKKGRMKDRKKRKRHAVRTKTSKEDRIRGQKKMEE